MIKDGISAMSTRATRHSASCHQSAFFGKYFEKEGNMNPQIVNIQEAGANFSSLIQTVVSGVEIIVTKEGKPIARISQIKGEQPKIRFGVLKGRVRVSDDFDAPLDEIFVSAASI